VLTRDQWLAGLKPDDPVRLVTPCGIHHAIIEGRRDNRLWILWALGHACDLGYSATWVDPATGDNAGHSYRIEPAESGIVKRESFND